MMTYIVLRCLFWTAVAACALALVAGAIAEVVQAIRSIF